MTYALRTRRAIEARLYDPAERVRRVMLRRESRSRAIIRAALIIALALALAI